jgi:hypothetical protein
VRRLRRHPDDVLSDRQRDECWRRFCEHVRPLIETREYDRLVTIEGQLMQATLMRVYLDGGQFDGWRFASLHEARAFGLESYFRPLDLPRPTGATPGSEDKITQLELRLDAGLELFHPADQA